MIQKTTPALSGALIYPDSDGKPIAENTKQMHWIVLLFTGIATLFRNRVDVFVAADLFWYPVEGRPDVRIAPDVLVIFGRPKGDRGSYRQWEEGGVPLTVAFEVLAPSNTAPEMADKQAFYEKHGVEEYYLYDPDSNHLQVFLRRGDVLESIPAADGFVSPRLGIRFDLSSRKMVISRPDGQHFLTFAEAYHARVQSQAQINQDEYRAAEAQRRLARLAELGRKARQGQASPEELQELERLEEQSLPAPPP